MERTSLRSETRTDLRKIARRKYPPSGQNEKKNFFGFHMSNLTTTSNLGPLILESLAPGMLYTPTPMLPYHIFAEKQMMPANSGTTLTFMRPRALKPPTTILGNSGTDPAPQIPQRDVIKATLSDYGLGCLINYKVLLQDQEGVLAWVSERIGVACKEAEDLILRDFLVSASSKIYASGSNGDNPGNLTPNDFSLVSATLATNNALFFSGGIRGSNQFGTGPIRSTYSLITSTELRPDFDAMTNSGFKNVWDYPGTTDPLECEYGSIYNIRVFDTSFGAVDRGASLNGRDVYHNIVLGRQAITHVGQSGTSMELIYRDALYSGFLAQNVSIGARFMQGQALTQDTAIRDLLCTRSGN